MQHLFVRLGLEVEGKTIQMELMGSSDIAFEMEWWSVPGVIPHVLLR
jgi:hypothetical protein